MDYRKFLNTLALHIEGIRHPPICLVETLFSCQCPFKLLARVPTEKNTNIFFRLYPCIWRRMTVRLQKTSV
jgi:hypothetical protein